MNLIKYTVKEEGLLNAPLSLAKRRHVAYEIQYYDVTPT